MHLLQLLLAAVTLAQPITLVCPNACETLSQSESTEFLLSYNNPNSLLSPFPFVASVELVIFDYRNNTRRSSRTFDWTRGNAQLTIPFRPIDYMNHTDTIGVQLTWRETNFDGTLHGIGSGQMLYIDIKGSSPHSPSLPQSPVATTANGSTPTLVIGSKSSATDTFSNLVHNFGLIFLLYPFL
jgi:hypothetical protein